jgi:uncharacterized protein YhfF
MKKIMFNDKYGLTDAVLDGRKTMTRRIVPIDLYNQTDWKAVTEGDWEAVVDGEGYYHDIRDCGRFRVGEIVAIAQSYKLIFEKSLNYALPRYHWLDDHIDEKGFANKMFVKAGEMPHHIKITDIKVERLQDISEEDCLKEGIMEGEFMNTWDRYYFDEWGDVPNHITFKTAREAFAALIDKVSGKGTWEKNPWVFVYEFKLID